MRFDLDEAISPIDLKFLHLNFYCCLNKSKADCYQASFCIYFLFFCGVLVTLILKTITIKNTQHKE